MENILSFFLLFHFQLLFLPFLLFFNFLNLFLQILKLWILWYFQISSNDRFWFDFLLFSILIISLSRAIQSQYIFSNRFFQIIDWIGKFFRLCKITLLRFCIVIFVLRIKKLLISFHFINIQLWLNRAEKLNFCLIMAS